MASAPQQNQSSRVSTLPLIVFGVASLIFGYLMWVVFPSLGTLPPAASQEALRTDALFRVLMGISGVVFFFVQGLIYYAAIAFRAKPGDASDGPSIHGNVMIEIVWTIVPSVIVVFLAIASYRVWIDNTVELSEPNVMMTVDSTSEEVAINAIGQRYAWSFQYTTNDFADAINDDDSISENAGDRIIINTTDLFIYDGQQVDINMNSIDVIHSFWAPEMRVKQDLLPGRTTGIQFTPQLPEATSWENVMLVSPVTVYTEADTGSDVLFEVLLEEGALPQSVEIVLADSPDSAETVDGELIVTDSSVLSPNPESGTAWIRVLNERGDEGFLPVNPETAIARFNRYRLICAELCGGGHGDMFTDIVMLESQDRFLEVWYTPTINTLSVPAGDPFELGLNVIGNFGCAGCHVLGDLGWSGNQGPALDGIGARSTDRASASADAVGNPVDVGAEYIAQSLRRSQDYLVAGFPAIMPYFRPGNSVPVEMPQEQLNGIVAYLCTQTGTGDPLDSDCGLNNWEFDENGAFIGDVDALVEELTAITADYED